VHPAGLPPAAASLLAGDALGGGSCLLTTAVPSDGGLHAFDVRSASMSHAKNIAVPKSNEGEGLMMRCR